MVSSVSLRTSRRRPCVHAAFISWSPVAGQGMVSARLVPAAPVMIWQFFSESFFYCGCESFQLLGIKTTELSCLGEHMAIADKLAESNLFCFGSCLIIAGSFFIYNSRRDGGRTIKLTRIDGRRSWKKIRYKSHFPLLQGRTGMVWALEIDEFVFEIIFNDQMAVGLRVSDQFQTTFHRHDLTPFSHMCR